VLDEWDAELVQRGHTGYQTVSTGKSRTQERKPGTEKENHET